MHGEHSHNISATNEAEMIQPDPENGGSYDEEQPSHYKTDSPISRSKFSAVPQNEYLSSDEKELLRFELNCALVQFLQAGRSIVLEGLGVLSPHKEVLKRTYVFKDWAILRDETKRTAIFEKSEDISGISPHAYHQLVDTWELVQTIYSKLPLPLQIRWAERELRKVLLGYLREIKDEIIQRGFSHQLRGVGIFHALHNRQGESARDWFAGADIFVNSSFQQILSLGANRRISRPVLETAWELLEAGFGTAHHCFEFSLSDQLKLLGFSSAQIDEFKLTSDTIRVSAFKKGSSPQGNALLFVTDGIRGLAPISRPQRKLRHELVFEVVADYESESVCAAASRALTIGAVLLLGDPINPINANTALTTAHSLDPNFPTRLKGALLTSWYTCCHEQLSKDVEFQFASVIGITADESELVARRGKAHLLSLLRRKGAIHQTVLKRPSCLLKSSIE